jgi:hypothetical protein
MIGSLINQLDILQFNALHALCTDSAIRNYDRKPRSILGRRRSLFFVMPQGK